MKRLFDFILSLCVIVTLSPLLIIVALIIKLSDGGPIFFKQKRLGKNKQVFTLYKFRSMAVDDSREVTQTYSHSDGVTKFGHIIRRLKIDELPQIYNVLAGDMSIVGPRPCLPELISEFNDDAFSRLFVRPGLTGLAQVNGNIFLSWEERWKFDKEYVEKQSFLLDFKIIYRTIYIVFAGEEKGLKS